MEEIELIPNGSKAQKYELVLKQAESLCHGEPNLVANLSNITALLKQTFNWFWIGFYLVENTALVLGPFQGPVACTRIQKGKGVCGSVWEKQATIIAPDVNLFPGHISCNAASQSEIVVPIVKNGKMVAVLDVDSDELDSFDGEDKLGLEALAILISSYF